MVNRNYKINSDNKPKNVERVDSYLSTNVYGHNNYSKKPNHKRSRRHLQELKNTLKKNEIGSTESEKKTPLAEERKNRVSAVQKRIEPSLGRYTPVDKIDGNFDKHNIRFLPLPPINAEKLQQRTSEVAKIHKYPNLEKPFLGGSLGNSGSLPTIEENGTEDSFEMIGDYSTNKPRFNKDRISNAGRSTLQLSESNINEFMPVYCREHKSSSRHYSKPSIQPPYSRNVEQKGTHPDSLYRVAPSGSSCGVRARALRAARALRWPLALSALCIGLAVSIYFLMPDVPTHSMSNSTIWGANFVMPVPRHQAPPRLPTPATTMVDIVRAADIEQTDTLPALNDTDLDAVQREIRKLVSETKASASETAPKSPSDLAPPFFPEHIAPRVQYGSERYEPEPHRERTLDKHPANIYGLFYKDGDKSNVQTETKIDEPHKETNQETNRNIYRQSSDYHSKLNVRQPGGENAEAFEENQPTIYHQHLTNFSSGHQNLFGISIEDANKMKPTTPNPIYNTRVSPTLPTLRTNGATTMRSKNGSEDGAQCASTRLRLCRGVLPYDLAAAPLLHGSVDAMLPFLEYVAASECSPRARLFICSLLEPECLPASQQAHPPCRSACRAVVESCGSVLTAGGSDAAGGAFECARYPTAGACVAARGRCLPDEMRCGDGACLPARWRCDGREDCADGEDERDCPFCARHEIRCTSDGSCVPRAWACDGYADCADGSDESACAPIAGAASEHAQRTLPPPKHVESESSKEELLITSDSSSMKTFPYGRTRGTVRASTPRAGTPQTGTAAPHTSTPPAQVANVPADELERRVLAASSHASPCPPGELRCVDGRCIMFSQLCDGYSDCSDNADENNCYF